jgi:DNA polymerase elongation subunit (family B)
MYRNIVYNGREQKVTLFTWDEAGKRIHYDCSFSPYLYVEDSKGEKTSIYGTKVKRKTFRSNFERRKFIADSGIKRLFENLSPAQQFLVDMFWKDNESESFSQNPIRTIFIDIETYSPNAFPDTQDPRDPINVITCYDTLSKKYTTFGTKKITKKLDDNINYITCKGERELFSKFIDYLEKDYPDIISGWNSEFFDIPYIINRCERVMGEEYVRRLSPLSNVYARLVKGKFGKDSNRYYIDGVSCIDYLDIYRKFCLTMRESYKLDAIAELELGENKVDYGDIDLATLADTDWDKFVEYNIHDVRLLVKLEEKLQYISLLRMLAYIGLTTFEGALGSISLLTGVLCIRARYNKEVMATFVRGGDSGTNPGAFVSEPLRGFQNYFVSFDAASLYPSIMMSLNMSPETKVGRFRKTKDGNFEVLHTSGKTFTLPPDKFSLFLKKEQCCLSKADIIFTQKKKGIVCKFLEENFDKRALTRKEHKSVLKEMESLDKRSSQYKDLKFRAQFLDTKQLTQKIVLNSLYGAFGNKNSPFGDDDIAASVTLTGQSIIKQANTILRTFLENSIDDLTQKEKDECNIYGDTDSVFFSIKSFITRGLTFEEDGEITQGVYELLDRIETNLNSNINQWCKRNLLSQSPRINFKREKLCDVGMFLQKKRYAVRIRDNEGQKCCKFKYTGVEVVRSTMPNAIKPYAKKIIETMMITQSNAETNTCLNDAYNTFKGLSPEEIAFVMGVKGYDKYASQCKEFNIPKRMPIHVKSAYYHNHITRNIFNDNKAELITSGDKVRYLYLQLPNKFNIESIGFKYEYPKEFMDMFKIDYDRMFEKILFQSISRFYDSVGWRIRKPTDNVRVELFDLFS